MQGLGQCGIEASPERVRKNWVLRIGVPLGIAAGLAIAAGTWMHERRPAGPAAPVKVAVNPGAGGDGDELAVPTESPDETLEKGRYAYLDKDAQRFVSFVADQVPRFPGGAQ